MVRPGPESGATAGADAAPTRHLPETPAAAKTARMPRRGEHSSTPSGGPDRSCAPPATHLVPTPRRATAGRRRGVWPHGHRPVGVFEQLADRVAYREARRRVGLDLVEFVLAVPEYDQGAPSRSSSLFSGRRVVRRQVRALLYRIQMRGTRPATSRTARKTDAMPGRGSIGVKFASSYPRKRPVRASTFKGIAAP